MGASHGRTTAIDPARLARRAHLRYVSDSEPGYRRVLNGRGHLYLNSKGGKVRDRRLLRRFEELAIPPAWKDVWICPLPDGHLQATGRDDRGRKQYIYHERWRTIADQVKFRRLADFARHLPRLRSAVTRDLRSKGLTRRRVLAGMVALLDLTSIRIGNEEYVRENGSYGLATLRTRHVKLNNQRIMLKFRGKGGLVREVSIQNKPLARLLRELKELPGDHVFQYQIDAGQLHQAVAADVNEYLQETTGKAFTAKDFRTWKASVMAAGRLVTYGQAASERQRKRTIKQVLCEVAAALGNTPTVCRKYYVHADLLDDFLSGKCDTAGGRSNGSCAGAVAAEEQAFRRFLRQWQQSRRLAAR